MLKNRHALSKREIKNLITRVEDIYACGFPSYEMVEVGEAFGLKIILVDGSPDFITLDDTVLFTVSAVERYEPGKGFVVVDKGAVRFVSRGADIMAPGVVDADLGIRKGDPVWVKEETHGKVIAVGISLMDGEEMIELDKGKAVRNVHWVGDRIWKLVHG